MTRLLPVILLAASVGVAAPPDPIELPIIAEFPQLGYQLVCGDADRDGHRELYAWVHEMDSLYVFEHVSSDSYTTQPLPVPHVPTSVLCLDLGDADRDGRADLVIAATSFTGRRMFVLESPDSTSLPSEVTWTLDLGGRLVYSATVTDLDQDSAREISYSRNHGAGLWECTGDNAYDSIAYLCAGNQITRHDYGDTDRDRKVELVFPCKSGRLYVYEATGNDRFDSVAVCSTTANGYGINIAITNDMDGDGAREMVLMGQASYLDLEASVEVWECTGVDSYEQVWQQALQYGWDNDFAAGDIDGDGKEEFAVLNDYTVLLYKCTGDNQYEVVWSHEAPSMLQGVEFHDFNGNGRDELIHGVESGDSIWTVARELPDSGAIAERPEPRRAEPQRPTLLTRAQLLAELHSDPTLSLFDASGRLVAGPKPGVLFVRSESATRRIVLTH